MNEFKNLLKEKLRKNPRRHTWKPRRTRVTTRYPLGVQVRLYQFFRRYLKEIRDIYKPSFERNFREDWRQDDSWKATMAVLMQWHRNTFEKDAKNVISGILAIGEGADRFNRRNWKSYTEMVVGKAIETEEMPFVNTWATTNFRYFADLSNEYIGKINTTVARGVREGKRADVIAGELARLDGVISGSRARLIARDQVGKLVGQLTKGRMESVEIDMYEWSTSGDERVRGRAGGRYPDAVPSHDIMDGMICRWDDHTVWSRDGRNWERRPFDAPHTIPGDEIQCRCSAIPYIQHLVDALNDELDYEEL